MLLATHCKLRTNLLYLNSLNVKMLTLIEQLIREVNELSLPEMLFSIECLEVSRLPSVVLDNLIVEVFVIDD